MLLGKLRDQLQESAAIIVGALVDTARLVDDGLAGSGRQR
jgi:hypothetical protein